MHDSQTHPLLAQVPLMVSPFVSLPVATTLPYTYKTLPSTLPPSSTGAPSGADKKKYVISSSGHAAHPDEIIASCKALQAYIMKVQDEADEELKAWQAELAAKELAEKRRVAPGWLDSEARILEPERVGQEEKPQKVLMDMDMDANVITPAIQANQEGDDLDRAFGGLGLNETMLRPQPEVRNQGHAT